MSHAPEKRALWIACEHPERPLDLDVGFHSTNRRNEPYCHGCVVAYRRELEKRLNVDPEFLRELSEGETTR